MKFMKYEKEHSKGLMKGNNTMKILYFDCFSGISGDMTLGAFIDLGVKSEFLIKELKKLNLEGYTIEVSKKVKKGLVGTDVNVILDNKISCTHQEHTEESHHQAEDSHDHTQPHTHTHGHEGIHQHIHNQKPYQHRSYKDIIEIIKNSSLSDKVKKLSLEMFFKIAAAEAKIHGKTIDEVHFHEVGAIDSILDIVGAAICFYELEVDKVVGGPLHTGTGTIRCAHGIIPVPCPATLEILRQNKVPFYSTGIRNELVTPTGAAIAATLIQEFRPLEEVEVQAIGYGLGKREMEIAGMLRLMLVETKKSGSR